MAERYPPPLKHWGWRFNASLDRIQVAFDQALQTSLREQTRLRDEIDRAVLERLTGAFLFEDEYVIPSLLAHEERLAEELYDVDHVARFIVEGFLMTLFHFWEKQIKDMMGSEMYVPTHAFGWLKHHGFKPECRSLTELKYLAETIKHSEGTAASRLFEMKKSQFDSRYVRAGDDAYYDVLQVSDADFHHYLDVVRRSGPQGRELAI